MQIKVKPIQSGKNKPCGYRIVVKRGCRTMIPINNSSIKGVKPLKHNKVILSDGVDICHGNYNCSSNNYIDQEEKDIAKTIEFLDWYLKKKKSTNNS